MKATLIYTIGYGNRKFEDFIQILQNFEIDYLLDVRSRPYSKFNPDFSQDNLKSLLKDKGITYGFLGDTLGGRPDCPDCYDQQGKVDYEVVKQQNFFQRGLLRIRTAYQKQLKIVLMCSESKPEECHRTKLIGEELIKQNIKLSHIDEKGRLKSQHDIMLKLTKGRNRIDLFGNAENFRSRRPYLEQ